MDLPDDLQPVLLDGKEVHLARGVLFGTLRYDTIHILFLSVS